MGRGRWKGLCVIEETRSFRHVYATFTDVLSRFISLVARFPMFNFQQCV